MTRRNLLAVGSLGKICGAVFLLALVCGARGEVPAPAAEKTAQADAEERAERVKAQIRVIRATGDPHEAMTAYARGCTADRSSIGLHNIYLRRMLTFGLPQIAQYPARALVGLDPANGMAWGVTAYSEGKRRKLDKAFEAALRAAELLDKNPSVLHNAGQTVAWQEKSRESKGLSKELEARKNRVRKNCGKRKRYTGAYEKIARAYAAYHRVVDDYNKRVETAEAQYADLEAAARRFDREMKRLFARVEDVRAQIRRLWSRYHGMESDPHWFPPDEEGNIPSYPVNSRVYHRIRRELRSMIHEQEKREQKAEDEFAGVREKGVAKVREMKKKKQEIPVLRAEAKKKIAAAKPAFEWLPPAVDGVVTPERPLPKARAGSASSGGVGAGGDAAKQLRMAKLYISNGLPHKAHPILKQIVKKYPGTEEAREAEALLASTPGLR